MTVPAGESGEARFAAYVGELVRVVGHADRSGPLRDYCTGLLIPAERKSVEPMAAVPAPARVAAQHQSLLHFVGQAPWSDERFLAKVRDLVLPWIEGEGPIEAWIIDDTSYPKKGRHSVGVARPCCGQLGEQDNRQVAVTLSLANHAASPPVAHRLSLPEDWASDLERRRKAGVPEAIAFRTKPAIALDQIRTAVEAGLPLGVALMAAGYGSDTALRTGMSALGLSSVAGIPPNTSVWGPGAGPVPRKAWAGRGRPPKLIRRDLEHQPASVKALALGLPQDAWAEVRWREGSADGYASRFARLRVRAAHRDCGLSEPRPEEWLLIEWPEGEDEPPKYWLSTLPEEIAFARLVDLAKLRWRIERDYQELKQERGLGPHEGRGWRGFHHHAGLCIAAYGFLIAERARIPPSRPASGAKLTAPDRPEGYRPRGATDPARTAHPKLDRDRATTAHGRPRQEPRAMSVLRHPKPVSTTPSPLVTQ